MPIIRASRTPARRSVLCVHGTLGDHRVWQRLIGHVPADINAVALDLPDHGESPDERSLDIEPMVAAVARCLSSLPGPVTLVGHSFGAYLVAEMLAADPPGVERAVLIAGFASIPTELAQERATLADQIESGRLDSGALQALAVPLFLGGEGRPADELLVKSMMAQTPPPRLVRALRRVSKLANRSALQPFRTPCVVIHSRRDAAVPYTLGLELSALSRHAQLVALDGKSHAPQLTDPARVAELVF